MIDEDGFRPNVGIIVHNDAGRVLWARRIGQDAWQFPQGGVDPGEEPLEALRREVREEVGLRKRHFEVIESRGGYRYLFPNGHVRWKVYRGQEQTYFRCRFLGEDSDIRLETDHPEFMAYRWIRPECFELKWLPKFKRGVYRQVLADFFGV